MSEQKARNMSVKEAASYTRRGFQIWLKYCPEAFTVSACRQVVTALAPYLPLYFTARLVNAIAGGAAAEQVWGAMIWLLASTAAMGALRAVVMCWSTAIEESRCWSSFCKVLFDKLLSMDFCDVDDPRTYDLLTQIKQNASWRGWGLNRIYSEFGDMVEAVSRILGALALSVSLFALPMPEGSPLAWLGHPLCLAGMMTLMALSILGGSALYNKAQDYWTHLDGTRANRTYNFANAIAMQERHRGVDIRTYAQDRFIAVMAEKCRNDPLSVGPESFISQKMRGPMGACQAGSRAVSQAFIGAVYLFAGLKALGGAFGVGSIAQYVGALAGLSKGSSTLLETLGDMRTNAEYLKIAFELLDTPNSMYQGSLTTEKRADRQYEIEFRDVSFKYPNTETWALRHVSMKFDVGGRLAVVGENGSGKTTFIKLLCRLYDPTEGEILLNGIDIRKYRYDDYLALFSVVFQDFKLLAQPLGANVAAAEEYDRARAEQCLEKAGFKARLESLPHGLDTCLYREFEDDGVEISGGEAQKIALARVLYQDAPFIVLDEPTAALDPEAEAEVYAKFNDIVEDKTAIYISHRLSSCRFCDEIAVFDHGQVIQQGVHDELVESSGKYRDLWEAQAQYYQGKEE